MQTVRGNLGFDSALPFLYLRQYWAVVCEQLERLKKVQVNPFQGAMFVSCHEFKYLI